MQLVRLPMTVLYRTNGTIPFVVSLIKVYSLPRLMMRQMESLRERLFNHGLELKYSIAPCIVYAVNRKFGK